MRGGAAMHDGPVMRDEIDDETLWSWIDREAPELEAHLARHPADRVRVDALRATIAGIGAEHAALPERIGRYRILGVLGAGGMGVVYSAEQESPRRRVALKVIRGGGGARARLHALFEREAAALARLAHPGIAAIYEAGTTADGEPYFAMELAEGLPLQRWIGTYAPSRRVRLELFVRICDAVRHAHARGVVHCDLKPSNVVVDAEGRPKVLDFGLARIASAEDSERAASSFAGGLAGTLAYASPEQALGLRARVEAQSDVYSLGALLHELLTGTLPHELAGATLYESVRRIAEEPPRPPSRIDASLRGDLDAIVLKALEREPERRYADAGVLGDDLRRHLAGVPILARRTGLVERAWKRVRRRKLAALVGLLLCTSLGVAAFALAFPSNLPWPLGGDWLRTGAPWDELRWRADVPEIRIDERWYELVAIDGLQAGYVVGFTKQFTRRSWRKRFSEDLVQVLNRMGDPCLWEVDLSLRDLASGALVELEDVVLDSAKRDRTRRARNAWPLDVVEVEPEIVCRYEGRAWVLEQLDGVAADRLSGRHWYDAICEEAGRSPGERVTLVLRDPESGLERELVDVPRDAIARGDALQRSDPLAAESAR